MPERPLRLITNIDNERIILDNKNNILISFKTDDVPETEWIRQWNFLDILVALYNNSELWFQEMKAAGISDIVLPKPPKKDKAPFIPVIPELKVWNIKDVIGEKKND
jgi:hypothetical protein